MFLKGEIKLKKWFITITSALFILGGCGGENDATPTPAPAPEGIDIATLDLPDTYDEQLATQHYAKNCAGCHGKNLEGAGAYPHPITGLTKEEVYIAVVEGVGMMPAGMVKGDDAANLAAWIAAQE